MVKLSFLDEVLSATRDGETSWHVTAAENAFRGSYNDFIIRVTKSTIPSEGNRFLVHVRDSNALPVGQLSVGQADPGYETLDLLFDEVSAKLSAAATTVGVVEAHGFVELASDWRLPSIPPPTRDFTGRADELEELLKAVREHGGAMVYGVRGLGGVGKTELCLKLVEQMGTEYPDGHVLVELDGASDHPLSSAEAMAQVIRAYEPEVRLPESEDDLRRLYHQVLKGRRAILLLDDAVGDEQVEPLLPHTGCLTIVTSRRRFALPRLHRLDLDALTLEEAQELLLSLAPRLGADADQIAELLGRLPLALRLAGSAFAERPDLEPGRFLERLERRDERVGLVEAAVSFNYEALESEYRRLWRALAVFPVDFDVAGVAAVWAMEADAASGVLGGALYPVSLVEWRGGRWRLHSLACDFASSRLTEEERHTAARRHAGHYVGVLREADRLYKEGGARILEGLALFDTEWGNIQTGQFWAAAHADSNREAAEQCNSYPHAGFYCLNLRLHSAQWIRWLEAGRSAAASLGDRRREGGHLSNLGLAHYRLGKVQKAIDFYERGLAIDREIGDRRGQADALGNLGVVYANVGEVEKAIGYLEQALVIAREISDRRGEGNTLGNLGSAYAVLGDAEKAIEYYEQQRVIAREIGDRRGEGTFLGNLGMAYADLGEMKKTISYLEQALLIAREIGDRRGEGNVVNGLGSAYIHLGEVDKAIGYLKQALVIAREIGDRRGEGNALGNLGLAYRNLGEAMKAISFHEQTLVIAREIDDRLSEGNALGSLGQAYAALGEVEKAIDFYRQRLVIAREIGDRRGEGIDLNNLGAAYVSLGEVDKAIPLLQQALEIGRAIKNPKIIRVTSQQLAQLRDS
ncbi:MAG: tetratricopeptide repeat protein [bacterium]|nr:tetratricopeptide repeat protein [bacterium]